MEFSKLYVSKIDELNVYSPIVPHTDDADIRPIDCNPKICKCCGAPLHGGVCEYCGVEYDGARDIEIALDGSAIAKMLNCSIPAERAIKMAGLNV